MVEFWRYGPTPLPAPGIGAFARDHEAAGWDGLAFGENNKQPDPYAMLALAASATTRLKLGTATAVPIRHPLLAAISMATIQGVSGGRARFSIGRGDSAAKALQQKPMSIAEFETYLGRLRAYLDREEVVIDGRSTTIAGLTVVDPALDVPRPAIDAAATGPKMIELAAKVADSVTFAVGADAERLRGCIATAREASERVGRDFSTLGLGCYIQVAVTDGAGGDQARESIRALAMTFARFSAYEGKPLADVPEADREQIRRAGEVLDGKFRSNAALVQRPGGLPGELDFFRDGGGVDDEFIDRFAIVGSAERCAERLLGLVDLGLERVYIGTRFMGTDVAETNTVRIGRDVLPLVRAARAADPTPATHAG
jgi:5,10-methylenetetrahydromethanopterin reductase